jgi:tight adherence protein C
MMTQQVALYMGALVAVAFMLMAFGLSRVRSPETPEERLERLSVSPRPLEEAELELPFRQRVLQPWFREQVQAAGRLAPAHNVTQSRQNLIRAGHPYNLGVLDFLGVKLLFSMLCGILTVFLVATRPGQPLLKLAMTGVMMTAGFLLPDFWLGSRVRRRQGQILRNLPDALDMLTICVDAGAGLESAMLRISDKWSNEIAREFGKAVAEVRLGLTRREALQNLVYRTDVSEVGSFVAVLLQADQFGLSISNVLHTQSEQMRTRRWQRAEEEARKVPIKLLFPLVFLILPAMFAVTIGPAVPALAQVFSQLLGP